MKTGLAKKQKRTSIYFTEADEFVEICTYNRDVQKYLHNVTEHQRQKVIKQVKSLCMVYAVCEEFVWHLLLSNSD